MKVSTRLFFCSTLKTKEKERNVSTFQEDKEHFLSTPNEKLYEYGYEGNPNEMIYTFRNLLFKELHVETAST